MAVRPAGRRSSMRPMLRCCTTEVHGSGECPRGWDGLRGMLRRLLALNTPRHAAILAAFAGSAPELGKMQSDPARPGMAGRSKDLSS